MVGGGGKVHEEGELGHSSRSGSQSGSRSRSHSGLQQQHQGAGPSESFQPMRQAAWHQGWEILSFFSTPLPHRSCVQSRPHPAAGILWNTDTQASHPMLAAVDGLERAGPGTCGA